MKKILMMCGIMLASLTAMADGGQTINVSKVSKITFSGDNVIVHYNDGTADDTFDMSAIVLDFSDATPVERVAAAEKFGLAGKGVYNLQGQRVGDSIQNLSKGVYVVDGMTIVIK